MSEAGRPGLPLLRGSRNVAAGTYVAEQLGPYKYDLIASNGNPTLQQWGRSGTRRNPKSKSRADKLFKCTELPALENIDSLFADEERRDESSEDGGDTATFRTSPSPIEESDENFRAWLRVPHIAADKHKDELWLPSLRQVRCASTRRTSLSCNTCGNFQPRNIEFHRKWHLLLSHKTFRSYSDQQVSSCLVYTLDLDGAAADEKVAKARRHRFVVLQDFEEKGDAFKKLQQLRSQGFQVQVVMDFGLPGDSQDGHYGRPPKQEPSAYKRSYTDFFFRAGADKSASCRHLVVSPHRVSHHCSGLDQWRDAQGGDFEQDVIVEDPVALFEQGALFEEEKEHTAAAKKKREKPMFKAKPLRQTLEYPENSGTSPKGKQRKNTMKLDEDGAIPDMEIARPKEASPARKEACMLLRFFVLGYFGNGNDDATTAKELEPVFREAMGSKEQVRKLHELWCRIDHDGSGRVDFLEFKVFAEEYLRSKMKLVGMMQQTKQQTRRESGGSHAAPKNKVIQKVEEMFAHALEDYSKFITSLHTKLGAALLGKKSSFCLEDMMKLMWLGTMPADTKAMLAWCREFKEEAVRNRVATPPILDAQEFEGLCAVFEHFDEDRNGEIQFDKLVTKGLIYVEQVDSYRQLWDANGDGILSLQEFCEMMCPVGYRATGKSEVGFMPDGRCVRHDPVIGHWKLAADAHHLDDRQFPVEIEPAELE